MLAAQYFKAHTQFKEVAVLTSRKHLKVQMLQEFKRRLPTQHVDYPVLCAQLPEDLLELDKYEVLLIDETDDVHSLKCLQSHDNTARGNPAGIAQLI